MEAKLSSAGKYFMSSALGRRMCLLSIAGLGASCATGGGQHAIPGVRTQLLKAEEPFELAPGEAIVTGVAISVRHFPQAGAGTPSSGHRSFIFADASGGQWAVPLLPISEDTTVLDEGGARLWIRPFATKVRAGRHRVIGVALFTGTGRAGGWDMVATAPVAFELPEAQISYIGGLGVLDQELRFPDQAAKDAGCPEGSRSYALLPGHHCYRFMVRFTRANEMADLQLIRHAYPALASATITALPTEAHPNWKRWPAVLNPFA
jgi:hypothetical protein